jgi:hypothetical protein
MPYRAPPHAPPRPPLPTLELPTEKGTLILNFLDQILGHADSETRLALRCTSHSVQERVDKLKPIMPSPIRPGHFVVEEFPLESPSQHWPGADPLATPPPVSPSSDRLRTETPPLDATQRADGAELSHRRFGDISPPSQTNLTDPPRRPRRRRSRSLSSFPTPERPKRIRVPYDDAYDYLFPPPSPSPLPSAPLSRSKHPTLISLTPALHLLRDVDLDLDVTEQPWRVQTLLHLCGWERPPPGSKTSDAEMIGLVEHEWESMVANGAHRARQERASGKRYVDPARIS